MPATSSSHGLPSASAYSAMSIPSLESSVSGPGSSGATWAVGAAGSSQDAGAVSSMSIRSVAVSAVCPSVRSVFHLESCAAGQRLTSGHQPHSGDRSEEHTSELQSRGHLVCRLLLEKKK